MLASHMTQASRHHVSGTANIKATGLLQYPARPVWPQESVLLLPVVFHGGHCSMYLQDNSTKLTTPRTGHSSRCSYKAYPLLLHHHLYPVYALCLQDINEAEGIASVHKAFRLGINFFDSSPFYGSTKSETVRLMLQLRMQR
jgi:hypothetical protein